MSKYVIIDQTGMLPAFYSSDVHESIPDGAVDISDAIWMDFLENQGRRKWNAKTLVFDPIEQTPIDPPIPGVISDRQCFQQLAIMGKISQDEALAAVRVGALPKVVTDGIASLPAAEQFGAQMVICGATQFERLHPLTLVFLAFFGLGEADRDPLWTAAAAL